MLFAYLDFKSARSVECFAHLYHVQEAQVGFRPWVTFSVTVPQGTLLGFFSLSLFWMKALLLGINNWWGGCEVYAHGDEWTYSPNHFVCFTPFGMKCWYLISLELTESHILLISIGCTNF